MLYLVIIKKYKHMEKKQTAVEWLEEQRLQGANLDIVIEQAKQMEKEQIEMAYKEGNHSEMRGGKVIFEKMESYYNETYGG
jgi:hypothetical protein